MKEARQQQILDYLYRDGKVNVNELANMYHISKDTIRRDLTELEEQGILKRGYGGAVPAKRIPVGLDSRMKMDTGTRYLVAKKAMEFIEPGSFIGIDGGSTNLILASILPISLELKVVTNSFPVAEELRRHPNMDVIFLGGKCNKESRVTVGTMVYEQMKDFYFDQCFLGVYGIDEKIGCTVPAPYEDEVPVKKYFVEKSHIVNVMGAKSKIDIVSNYVVCDIDSIDRIICEEKVEEEINLRYQNKIVS